MTSPPATHPFAAPLDLARTFGPMSAMHAALDQAGIGMPCGLVAKFKDRTAEEVEAAIVAAVAQFPVLRSRLSWVASRPVLVPLKRWAAHDWRAPEVCPDFKAGADDLVWRYALHRDGRDVWLTAVWAHAAADGRSMLHFLHTVSAAMQGTSLPTRTREGGRARRTASLLAWLPRFLFERQLAYVKPQVCEPAAPGVSWLTLAPPVAEQALADARAKAVGLGAWLAAGACIAFCEQQRGERSGRVALDLLASRGDMAALGGFGFAAGSLLIPVTLGPGMTLAAAAQRIFARQRTMLAQGWDGNLERFIGRHPLQHRLFAAAEAKGVGSPSISVSWKGVYPELGAGGSIGDIACFAASSAAHVSAHIDANGLSISVASRLPRKVRDDLLRRIAALIGGATAVCMLSLEDLRTRKPAAEPAAAAMPDRALSA